MDNNKHVIQLPRSIAGKIDADAVSFSVAILHSEKTIGEM